MSSSYGVSVIDGAGQMVTLVPRVYQGSRNRQSRGDMVPDKQNGIRACMLIFMDKNSPIKVTNILMAICAT